MLFFFKKALFLLFISRRQLTEEQKNLFFSFILATELLGVQRWSRDCNSCCDITVLSITCSACEAERGDKKFLITFL